MRQGMAITDLSDFAHATPIEEVIVTEGWVQVEISKFAGALHFQATRHGRDLQNDP
jgi:hypothetical protein